MSRLVGIASSLLALTTFGCMTGCFSNDNVGNTVSGPLAIDSLGVFCASSGQFTSNNSGVSLLPGDVLVATPLGSSATSTSLSPLANVNGNFGGIALTATDVYVTSQQLEGDQKMHTQVTKISRDTGATTVLTSRITGISSIGNIVVDANAAYWINRDNTTGESLIRTAFDGSGDTTIAVASGSYDLADVAIDSNYAYLTQSSETDLEHGILSGNVIRVPLTGGDATVLVSEQVYPGEIVIDDTNLYFSNALAEGGTVMEAPLAGGQPIELGGNEFSPGSLTINDGYLYWANSAINALNASGSAQGIMRAKIGSGASAAKIIDDENAPTAVAVDAIGIYWIDDNGFHSQVN